MLKVKVELRPSPIHGIGVFTLEDIKAGTVVNAEEWPDRNFLNESPPESLKKYAYLYVTARTTLGRGGMAYWLLPEDECRFLNHSDTPNLDSSDDFTDVAIHDILAGTELTVNYFTFDLDASRKLGRCDARIKSD